VKVKELYEQLWRQGYGSITAPEAEFIAEEIARHKPRSFVEIGTATGLSTVMIATALQRNGLSGLTTLDHSKYFFGDNSKLTGFVIDDHFGEGGGGIGRLTGLVSADLREHVDPEIGMAFIDANHGHPWPTIDTLMIWPLMAEGALLFHHDLRLYQKSNDGRSVGPKFLYDQMPDEHKRLIDDADRNMFWIRKAADLPHLARRLADSLMLPWESTGRIGLRVARKIADRLSKDYPPLVEQMFTIGFDRFNGR